MLQFADNTLIMRQSSWQTFWCIKALLGGFELDIGLHVNFNKRKFIGISLKDNLLQETSTFLECGTGIIPFQFLGIPVEANPKRKVTWFPIF